MCTNGLLQRLQIICYNFCLPCKEAKLFRKEKFIKLVRGLNINKEEKNISINFIYLLAKSIMKQ